MRQRKRIKQKKIIIFSLFLLTFIMVTGYSLFNTNLSINTKGNLKHQTWIFDYTGSEQTFTIPYTGNYKLEVWGAQGGYYNNIKVTPINYGGYSVGTIQLNKDQILYINVGGKGQSGYDALDGHFKELKGGYNGGGKGYTWVDSKTAAGGGGATHIAFESGLLSTLENKNDKIIIVAGAGGGQGNDYNMKEGQAGAGGGFIGNKPILCDDCKEKHQNIDSNTGGTQTEGGENSSFCSSLIIINPSSFGQGGSGVNEYNTKEVGNSSGGGSGYYGGGGSCGFGGFGAGGSGYIGNNNLTNKHMTCYNCEISDEESTKTISNTCKSEDPKEDCGKEENGYAIITYLGKNN